MKAKPILNEAELKDLKESFFPDDLFVEGKQFAEDGILLQKEPWQHIHDLGIRKLILSIADKTYKENLDIDFVLRVEEEDRNIAFFCANILTGEQLAKITHLKKKLLGYEEDSLPPFTLWCISIMRKNKKILCITFPFKKV